MSTTSQENTRLRIAIVGGGASGALSAIHCMERLVPEGMKRADFVPELLLFTGGEEIGKGQAYGTRSEAHLLNVPADRMGYSSARPTHFLEWLREKAFPGEDLAAVFPYFPFVPRHWYAKYLAAVFLDAKRGFSGKFTLREEKVRAVTALLTPATNGVGRTDASNAKSEFQLITAKGETFVVDAVFYCAGYRAKSTVPSPLAVLPERAVIDSAHAPDLAVRVMDTEGRGRGDRSGGVTSAAEVILIGKGLSAIDAFRELRRSGFSGTISFLSRRGLFPLPHGEFSIAPDGTAFLSGSTGVEPFPAEKRTNIRGLFREFRRRHCEEKVSYRALADAFRPAVEGTWRNWSERERARFLRHAAPYWEVIRHRVPKPVQDEIAEEIATGKARSLRGRMMNVAPELVADERGLRERFRLRYSDRLIEKELVFDRAVLAMGVTPAADPMPGVSSARFFRIGPMAKGEAWEITAIPEIRAQIERDVGTLT